MLIFYFLFIGDLNFENNDIGADRRDWPEENVARAPHWLAGGAGVEGGAGRRRPHQIAEGAFCVVGKSAFASSLHLIAMCARPRAFF